jgi:hypothetical protein
VLSVTVFPFMSTRFVIYEETIAYMTVCELLALSGYVLTQGTTGTRWACLMGVASGFGLLIRPTGLIHVGVWGAILALGAPGSAGTRSDETLRLRARRVLGFLGSVTPFVGFWLWSNRVRTGSLLGLGFNNSNPAWSYGTPQQRFGSLCLDTPWHAIQAQARLFTGFFLYVTPHAPLRTWLGQCHFDLEERDGTGEPFFGPVVLALLVWILARYIARRERRLAVYVPFGATALLVASFLYAGAGFAWRYTGDFWPLIVLACVQSVQTSPARPGTLVTLRLAKFLFWLGFAYSARFLVPWGWFDRPDLADARHVARMGADFRESRWGKDAPVPSRITCGQPPTSLFHDGLGWNERCAVETFTNVYLGVLPKEGDHYRLHLTTAGFDVPSLRVYVNGTIYTARHGADGYDADVTIPFEALTSPIVLTTVEWTRSFRPPAGRLLAIELG